jgi:hypothetical protein
MPTKLTATGISFPTTGQDLAGVATTLQATTGTDDTVAMTPLKVAQAIAEATIDYQPFTASGTWTTPTGISADAMVTVEAWGAGGGGGRTPTVGSGSGAGGGGGGYTIRRFRLGDLLDPSYAVGVGAGGNGTTTSWGDAGGNSTFGTLVTAYGGAGGRNGGSNTEVVGGLAGTLFGAGIPEDAFFSGGRGFITSGENAYMGGAGGAGGSMATGTTPGGTSINGGNGGNGVRSGTAGAGSAPAGGGGGSAGNGTTSGAGARGEVRVSVVG